MLNSLLRLLAALPLRWFHATGVLLGWVVYLASPRYAARLRANLMQSRLGGDAAGERRLLHRCVAEAGKGVLELVPIWFGKPERVAALVRECSGWEHVEAGLVQGRGIIFLTPHLGCFEISARYAARHFPMTVLYRPPKLDWLAPLMTAGRARGQLALAPADVRGVRMLLRALKRGQAVGLLPDQAPGVGEGVWADFFGRPAYTMTLPGKLAEATGALVLLAFAKRMPRGQGYRISITPFTPNLPVTAANVNTAVEKLVRECPEQYLWSYNRYKKPAGATARPAAET